LIEKIHMQPNEKYRKQEVDPNRILEQHLKGLRSTSEAVADFRMHSRLGNAGIQEQQRHGRHTDGPAEFALAATRYSETLDPLDPENKDARMYASILGAVPPTIEARHLLDREKSASTRTYNAKMQMIQYNNILRNIIDTNPKIDPDTILGLVRSTTLSYRYGADDINMISQHTQRCLVGVKHELGFESPLYYLPEGFEILDTTDQDDKEGIDYRVLCPNGVIVEIDVKASQELADKAIRQDEEFNYFSTKNAGKTSKKLILYSGFSENDFDPRNPWRPEHEAVERVYPAIEKALIEASGEEYIPSPIGVR
jgi:hypothetical protein